MSISSISSGSGLSAAQLYRLRSTTNLQADSSSTSPQKSSGGSRFATAISDAFASLGISFDANGTSTTSSAAATADGDTSSSDTSDSAVGAFVQSLFAALHSQSTGNTPPPPGDDGSDATTSASTTPVAAADASGQAQATGRAHHGHGGHGHGGGGKIGADLQSLIQELSTSASTATDASTTTTGTASSSDSTLATLEKNFDALVTQSGNATSSTGTDSLASFLKALSSNLQGAPATGNVVTTQA